MRRVLSVLLLSGMCIALQERPASAQERFVGAGPGYLFDTKEDWAFFTAMGWLPVNGPDSLPFKPLVLTPRFSKFFGFGLTQFDVDMLWDIPVTDTNIHPYIGMGVGLARESFGTFSDTTPVLNIDAGLRYKRPDWKFQFILEAHHSSGINYVDTMVINLWFLFPIGKK